MRTGHIGTPCLASTQIQTSRRKAVCSKRHSEPFIRCWLESSQNPSSQLPAKDQSCKQDFQKIAVRCTILTFFCTYVEYCFICLLAFCISFPVKGKLKNHFFFSIWLLVFLLFQIQDLCQIICCFCFLLF